MTFWLVRADYRPLNKKSPVYPFVADSTATERYIRQAFAVRYPVLGNIAVRQVTDAEMEGLSSRKWLMWI